MAATEKDNSQTVTVDYSDRSDTPTTFGGLTKADKEQVAKEAGGKVEDFDYVVVSDNVGRSVEVKATPKK